MLRKPEDFYKEGSKVFRRAPVNRDLRNNQYQGVEPSEADVLAALAAMERMTPDLMAVLAAR